MPLEIKGLSELRDHLERLRVEEVMARALAAQAERVADAVRQRLSEPPGTGGHDEPWLQSGALRDSVGAEADGLQAAVGSSDPAAVPQEMGTAHMPPRPFLAPVAAGMGEEVARGVAEAVAAALKGEPEEGAVILADASSSGQTHSVPYNPLGVFQPGSPENEDWTHETLQRFQELGRIFHSEGQERPFAGGRAPIRSSRPSSPVLLTTRDAEVITGTRTLNRRTLKRCTRMRNGTRTLADELGTGRMPMANGINITKTTREALITPVRSREKGSQSRFAGGVSRWR